MLQIVRAPDPELYPGVKSSQEKDALWVAFPAAVISFDGTILAANKLASWVAGVAAPARQLLGQNIYELSAQLVLDDRIPMHCNVPFIRKKVANLARIDREQEWPAHRTFRGIMEAVKESYAGNSRTCPAFASVKPFDERSPWQYPLRMRQPGNWSGTDLLEFAVVEARLARGMQFLIVFEPDGRRTRRVLERMHGDHHRLYPDEAYAFAKESFDISIDRDYTSVAYEDMTVEIVSIGDMRESDKKKMRYVLERPERTENAATLGLPPGMPLVGLEPGRSMDPDDIRAICTAIDADHAPVPTHPLLGQSDSFRLRVDPAPGRVHQVDLFLRAPVEPRRAVVTVHRLDDLGDRQDQRYLFDTGYLHAADPSALSLLSVKEGAAGAIVVFSGGCLAEIPDGLRRVAGRGALPAPRTERGAEASPTFSLKDAITAPEAAVRLGLSRTHVHRLLERGDLRGTQVGDVWLVDRTDLANWRPAPRGRPRTKAS